MKVLLADYERKIVGLEAEYQAGENGEDEGEQAEGENASHEVYTKTQYL